jgi:hypothetical protein
MDKAKHYRSRAEKVRTIAEGVFDHEERKTLLEVAQEYENMALRGNVVSERYVQLVTEWQKRLNGTG